MKLVYGDDDYGWGLHHGALMMSMDGKVSRLGVIIAPWCEYVITFSFAGSTVHLDLDTSDLAG